MTASTPPHDRESFVTVAFYFEAGLGALAIGLGWLWGIDPLSTIRGTVDAEPDHGLAAVWGIVAVLPLTAGLLVVNRLPFAPFVRLKQVVEEHLLRLFANLSLFELAALSCAAGFGEEILFRGLLQQGLATWWGPPQGVVVALLTSSAVFGVCHWITRTYAVLAALAGLYLGLLFILTENLLAPLIAHALYDFVALLYLTRLPMGRPTFERAHRDHD